MHKFKDNTGHEWTLDLNLLTAQRIEASDYSAVYKGPVKLLNKTELDGDLFMSGLTNTGLLAALAYTMAKDEADKLGVDQDEFCRRIGPDQLDAMKEACWEEIANFIPEFRTFLSKLISTYRNATKRIGDKLSQLDPSQNIDSLIDSMSESLDLELKKISSQTPGIGQKSGASQPS